jgi:hypothetical protein
VFPFSSKPRGGRAAATAGSPASRVGARARRSRLVLILAAGAVFLPSSAAPCSICRCGDPTFNALGKEGYVTQGWRLIRDNYFCRVATITFAGFGRPDGMW